MSDPWFKFYPSDWLSGTRGLTPAETGIYITLICMMYEHEGKLPLDTQRLARRCGCTKASFNKILTNLLTEDKLTESNGTLTNCRVQKELHERASRVQKSVSAAHAKWAAHARKDQQNQTPDSALAMSGQASGIANSQSQNQNQNQSQNQSQNSEIFQSSLNRKAKGESPLQRLSRHVFDKSLPDGEE